MTNLLPTTKKPKSSRTTKSRDMRPNGEATRHKIAVAAYFRAQRRGFAPGHELDDWLSAEAEVTSHSLHRTSLNGRVANSSPEHSAQ